MTINAEQSVVAHPHCNVLGVRVSAINMDKAVSLAEDCIVRKDKGYVCVTGVHGVMESQSDPKLHEILNKAYINTPDGMPTVWVGRLQGHGAMRRVYGPDFMLELCRYSVSKGYRHFLYGGNPGVAEKLSKALQEKFPGLQIAGTYTPPFRPLNDEERRELVDLVHKTQPDVIWVGLSTPKQERFMAEYLELLDTHLMVGVGAAFDIHTGGIQDAPKWMKQVGLQWFHRLCQEPKRLWRRYLINNPKFVWRVFLQISGLRRFGTA